jgi:hypothetical protein
VPPNQKLGFILVVEIEDEKCDVMSGIPKEKGLEVGAIE